VNVETERVAEPVRVEGSADPASEDLFPLANEDAELDEALDEDLVGEKMDLVPVHSWSAERLALLQMAARETGQPVADASMSLRKGVKEDDAPSAPRAQARRSPPPPS
jgi:hypothetical protein